MSEQQRGNYKGVKSLSHTVVECPEFMPSKSAKSHWSMAETTHNDFLRDLASEVESSGFRCKTELKLEYHFPQGFSVRGSVDLVCENQDTVLLFEVKSFPLGYAFLGDRNQLLFYAYILLKQSMFPGKEIVPILVYKSDHMDPGMLPLKSTVVNLPSGQYVVLDILDGLVDAVESTVRVYQIITSSKRRNFIMGKHCFKCSNSDCVVGRARMTSYG
ncbi:hypothetical protein L3N51_01508 [Metallosphaera sp. J1]|uniref:hypothetical protein n=1 Tax=Metallosphaera javensis (ex Hofmann et al. 2022) TaxID=99938 RepID=UPI001EE07024|nr:hypothetical protein [Metallosphaera javensis (ex Hofmann et al. 2022)]MCG3109218.1 hypothetical protein [Metallosphaera javensis (ex Hofmann et al. 2022)]